MVEQPAFILEVYVQPGAKRTEFAGLHGNVPKVRLQAPPVDGQANACLLEFLALQCKVAKRDVRLVSGQASRHKRVAIYGLSAAQIELLRAQFLS